MVDVFYRGYGRVLACLYGVLFGRQPVGVIAHGVEHVVAAQALVSGINVAGYVT